MILNDHELVVTLQNVEELVKFRASCQSVGVDLYLAARFNIVNNYDFFFNNIEDYVLAKMAAS
jgi:hypothetical protein